MMVGLQGSGKTTTCAKLARYLQKENHKPLLVAADMQRPAAVEQLQVLGKSVDIPVFNIPGESPVDDLRSAPRPRRRSSAATSSSTTPPAASRSTRSSCRSSPTSRRRREPENIFLVVDAMIGQDAVKVSKGFHDRLSLSELTLSEISEKMRDIDFAMLSTRTAGGEIAARPMSNNRQVDYDGDNYFFTCQDTGTVRDITGDPNVGLSFQASPARSG